MTRFDAVRGTLRAALFGVLALSTLNALGVAGTTRAADWPMWRHDAGRTASTPEQLPEQLELRWTLRLGELRPAWDDPRLGFDASYEPVVAGGRVFVASSRTECLTAFDLDTAAVVWRFWANGPTRLAPIVESPSAGREAGERLWFGSDDGSLYALDAASGALLWRYDPHGSRSVLGNSRLMSIHPVRGGPVLADGRVWFTTGIWPFEGTFLHSVDLNGPTTARRPTTLSLDGTAPQGYIAATDGRLLLPCGRTDARCVVTATGASESLSYSAKGRTDSWLAASGQFVFHGDRIVDRARRRARAAPPPRPVIDGTIAYSADGGDVRAVDLARVRKVVAKNRKGKETTRWVVDDVWRLANERIAHADEIAALRANGPEEDPEAPYREWLANHPMVVALKAGSRVYGYQGRTLFAIDAPASESSPALGWSATIDGDPASLVAASGHLLVVTRQGDISCFGAATGTPPRTIDRRPPPTKKPDAGSRSLTNDENRFASVTRAHRDTEGYCVLLGSGSGGLLGALLQDTAMRVIVLEHDAQRADSMRRRLDEMGLYGDRVVVRERVALSQLPPYIANLVTAESADALWTDDRHGEIVEAVFRLLRPYGGVARLPVSDREQAAVLAWHDRGEHADARMTPGRGLVELHRDGALPGSSDWAREYGNEGNTLMSRDRLVRAPLGVLWFGGPSGADELFYNRHNWPPSTAIVGGRMFIQGPGKLTAVDVYTGRVFWSTKIRDGGGSPARNTDLTSVSGDRMGNPIFGTPPAGYHFLVDEDALYLAYPERCLVLDPRTGTQTAELALPSPDTEWGRVRSYGDLLIAAVLEPQAPDANKQRLPFELIAMDRRSGAVRWRRKAQHGFPYVAIGRGRVFCFDADIEKLYRDKRRGNKVPKATSAKLMTALDVETGDEKWSIEIDMVANWLSFSEDFDVVIASNSDEILALHGSDGYELWRRKKTATAFGGHPENLVHKVILWHDRVIDQRGPGWSYDLKTGADHTVAHPLTGHRVPWEFTKVGHHCNYAIASEHLLTFRAANAGFHDLVGGGTSRLLGFRSGCRNSLIPANGVLNAPNYATGCICSYSIFTSLALVHMPQNEKWSYTAYKRSPGRIRQLGLNLGAPGDRRSATGTLWLDWPSVGGPSPDVEVRATPEKRQWFRMHSSQVAGDVPTWVAASGARGLESLTIVLDDAPEPGSSTYTVRLCFAEPDELGPGERVFGVQLQGVEVLRDFDVVAAAGRPRRSVVREFTGVRVGATIEITLSPSRGTSILGGIELVAEEPAATTR